LETFFVRIDKIWKGSVPIYTVTLTRARPEPVAFRAKPRVVRGNQELEAIVSFLVSTAAEVEAVTDILLDNPDIEFHVRLSRGQAAFFGY
jgi:hypothetical protein